jgi:Putative peptidoglycan binding domain
MTLDQLASGAPPVMLAMIGGDKALTLEVQQRLSALGLLDPPADGSFGPVSQWAIRQFLRRIGTPEKARLDVEAARALRAADPAVLFPLNLPDTLPGRIAAALSSAGHWLCRHPDAINIVYVEGLDPDGTPNTDAPNVFNDLRLVLRVNRAGNPEIVDRWEATSEPGTFHTIVKKLDPRGAARIGFGQFKAWSVGTHMAGRPSAHEALVQTLPIRVHRDLNEDFERTGDAVFEGLFGVNQHWGFNLPKSDIGSAIAPSCNCARPIRATRPATATGSSPRCCRPRPSCLWPESGRYGLPLAFGSELQGRARREVVRLLMPRSMGAADSARPGPQ